MDILVDANILYGDPLMQQGDWPAVWAHLEKTKSKLLVPQVVRTEANSNHAKRCRDVRGDLEKRAREFQRLTGKRVVIAQPGFDGNVEKFSAMPAPEGDAAAYEERWKYLQKQAMVLILPYPPDAAEKIVARGEQGLPPLHNDKNNHRDGWIWLSLLIECSERPREMAFISNDKSAFTAKAGGLEPRLRSELGVAPIHFCLGLKDFLSRHGGETIEFLPEESFGTATQ